MTMQTACAGGHRPRRTILLGVLLVAFATGAHATCIGDCGDDNAVSGDDIITGVSIALGNVPLDSCGSFEAAGAVTVDGIITAVLNAAPNGCPGSLPTDTPTFTVTPSDTP